MLALVKEDIVAFAMSVVMGAAFGLAAGYIGVKRMRDRMEHLERWKDEMEANGRKGEEENYWSFSAHVTKFALSKDMVLSQFLCPNNTTGVLLEMKLFKCLRMVRSHRLDIYRYAAKRCGLSTTSEPTDAIQYSDEDLVLKIFFPNKMLCARFVDDVYGSFPVNLSHGYMIEVRKTSCRVPEHGVEIEIGHYIAEQSVSPAASVGSAVSSCTVSYALASSDEAAYQMFEDRARLSTMTFHNCHMVDSAECVNVGLCTSTEKSNLLCCSPNTHSMIDAVPGACPTLRIEPLDIVANDTVMDSKNRQRVRVNIRVHARELTTIPRSGIQFKEGSVQVSACAYDSFVHMFKPELFKECASWKNGKTLEKWV